MVQRIPATMRTDNHWVGGNVLMNGGMRIDQRNGGGSITVTSGSVHCVDRWRAGMLGANGTGQRVASGLANTPHMLRITGAGGTTSAWIGQYIESVNATPFVGQRATVSFYAASSNQTSVTVNLKSATAADNFTGTTTLQTKTQAITSTLTRYSVTFDTALAASAANGLYLEFVTGGNLGTGTLSLTEVLLEPGTDASPFPHRHYGQELALCQRYFFQANATPIGVTLNVSDGYSAIVHFPVPMRVNPTLVAASYSVGSGTAGTPAISATNGEQARMSNSGANWTSDVTVSLTAGFNAELT